MNTKQYFALGVILKKRIAKALGEMARDGSTISRYKALDRLSGVSIRKTVEGLNHFQLFDSVHLDRNDVTITTYLNGSRRFFRFPREIFEQPEKEWAGLMSAHVLEEASEEHKGKARHSYRVYLQLKKRWHHPKGLDWTIVEEERQKELDKKP